MPGGIGRGVAGVVGWKVGENAMNILSKLIGQDDKFFDLLEAGATEARSSIQMLAALLREKPDGPTVEDFIKARRKDKRIVEQITEELCKTFVTPLEREDIEALSFALYQIPKTAEKFSEKFLCCREGLGSMNFAPQLGLLEQAAEIIPQMIGELRSRKHLAAIKEQHQRLQALEGEADKLILEHMGEIRNGRQEPLKVIMAMDLYEKLEKIMDRYRDAGSVIFRVVLKYI